MLLLHRKPIALNFYLWITIFSCMFSSACTTQPESPVPTVMTASLSPQETNAPGKDLIVPTTKSRLPSPTLQAKIRTTSSRQNPSAEPTPQICSPLPDIPQDQLAQGVVNPYNPPRMGSDDPHQGIDLAILSPGTDITVAGAAVNAVVGGTVAAVIANRFPYGNAILIETPITALPDDWMMDFPIPDLAPDTTPSPALTCPNAGLVRKWQMGARSIYLMYAHLQEPPLLKPGDQVLCGEGLGAIGDSGNALNPHLHLEARVGPSGARFASMAHYTGSASPDEMQAYCQWRVSGWFVPFDPFQLLRTLN